MGGFSRLIHANCRNYCGLTSPITLQLKGRERQIEKEQQEGVHTCNQLFNHCDRSPAEKEGEPRKSKQKKNVNKAQNDSAGYQAKSRCKKKCTALKIQHIFGYRSGAGEDQQVNDQIKQAQIEKMIFVTSVLYFNYDGRGKIHSSARCTIRTCVHTPLYFPFHLPSIFSSAPSLASPPRALSAAGFCSPSGYGTKKEKKRHIRKSTLEFYVPLNGLKLQLKKSRTYSPFTAASAPLAALPCCLAAA